MWFIMILLGLFGAYSTGCAGGMNAARQTVANAAEVQAKGFKVLADFDEQHQKAIVDDAIAKGNLDGGAKALTEYRAKRKKAVDALKYAAQATLMAEALIPLVERGIKKQTELDGWLSTIIVAGAKIYATFAELGIKTGDK